MLSGENIVKSVSDLLHQLYAMAGLSAFKGILDPIVAAVVMFHFIAVFVMFLVWMERKVSAHMQSRIGPNRVGIFGLLQTVADAIKLTIKEDIKPVNRDKIPYYIAPIIAFVATFAGMVVIPFDKGMVVQDLNIGLLYIIAIT